MRLPLQAIIGASPGAFDLNALDSRRRGFAEGNSNSQKRPSPSSLVSGPFANDAPVANRGFSVRCWLKIGDKKVLVGGTLTPCIFCSASRSSDY